MKVAVYCGSSYGNNEEYKEATLTLAKWMIKNNYSLVYGGGKSGLMGLISDQIYQNSGEVIGIIPDFLCMKEIKNSDVTKLIIVDNMSERKKKMSDLSDIFIALPGGAGTLEEISEIISWSKLGQRTYPCILFNINGFYNPLKEMYQKMVDAGFLRQEELDNILFSTDFNEIDNYINNYKPVDFKLL